MKKTELFRRLHPTEKAGGGYLSVADALKFLIALRDQVADIVFLDPPFNLGKKYGPRSAVESDDPEAYDLYMRAILKQSIRILKPGGSLYLYHLPSWAVQWGGYLSEQLEFRNWIAVSMKNGFARGSRLYPAHYGLLYYTKGSPAHFSRPKIDFQRCPHCREIIKSYGGYRQRIERNGGLNLSDVWDDVSPIRHRVSKHRALNQLPQIITDRICAISGGDGLLLVDPFVGAGTSLVSALAKGMHFVANDAEMANIKICRTRISTVSPHTP